MQDSTPENTKVSEKLAGIMRKSLKTDRWDPIKETDPADFTNDKLVARWKAECDKWKAVRTLMH